MRFALTAAIFVIGLFDLMMASSFLFTPLSAGQGLGVAPFAGSAEGLSTIRGDFTSFFGISGVIMMWGAWRRNADLLLVPMLLFGVTLSVRMIDLVVSGVYAGWWVPMTVEAVEVVLLLGAWRYLPHHTIAELAD